MHAPDPWDAGWSVVASSRSPRPGVHLLVVVNELDMATAPQLSAATREILRHPPGVLAVDLAGVLFMASAGLDALLCTREDALAAGCRLVLVAVPRPVRRVIELIGPPDLFAVHDTLAAALAALGEPGVPS
ncbi:STAS domain-containing protein [Pseudonocardia sp.]|uniref:STAS domain-containing protein n=1 Tax=Pseudonocardia sp. TaxID=60912 RepID=UPI003D14FB25